MKDFTSGNTQKMIKAKSLDWEMQQEKQQLKKSTMQLRSLKQGKRNFWHAND